MTLQELFKEYGTRGGEETMWETVKRISDYAEEMKCYDECEFNKLEKDLIGIMCGKHYNAELARKQISKMFYTDQKGVRHVAPYWTEEQMHSVYNNVRHAIPAGHTEHDFWVALNMMKSDYGNLIESWFADNADEKVIEMTVSWFNDPDAKDGDTKTWNYFD